MLPLLILTNSSSLYFATPIDITVAFKALDRNTSPLAKKFKTFINLRLGYRLYYYSYLSFCLSASVVLPSVNSIIIFFESGRALSLTNISFAFLNASPKKIPDIKLKVVYFYYYQAFCGNVYQYGYKNYNKYI